MAINMAMRHRSIGLSRNQRVPPVLSTIQGRKRQASPEPTPYPHRSRPSKQDDAAPGKRQSPLDDDSDSLPPILRVRTQPSKSTLEGIGGSNEDETAAPFTASRRSSMEPQQAASTAVRQNSPGEDAPGPRVSAMFNPPPAASDSEDSSDAADNAQHNGSRKSGGVAGLLADSDSEDDLTTRGDMKPTRFGSASQREGNQLASLQSSQLSSLSQPTSSGASHLENEIGHVKKHKAKQTYSKFKTLPKSKHTQRAFHKVDAPQSPVKSRTAFRAPAALEDSPVSRGSRTKLMSKSDLDSDDELIPKTSVEPKRKRKNKSSVGDADRDEKKAKPTFWIPDGSPDRDISAEQTKDLLQAQSSSSLSDLDTDPDEKENKALAKSSVCPWCGNPVNPEALEEFSKGKRLNVAMQTRFCRSHQRQTAKDSWKEKGYPRIDWDTLTDRFMQHHDFLLGIVNGETSHFRDVLAEDVRSGKSRTLKQEDDLNPGYYGPRGFNVMCDFLVAQFGDLLKQRAVTDRVIAGRGSAAFIQSVLVAELAVSLIKEDMGVGEEEARNVLHESKELGDFVHEET